jgi:hypothetical protein
MSGTKPQSSAVLELESFYSITTFIGDMGPPCFVPEMRVFAKKHCKTATKKKILKRNLVLKPQRLGLHRDRDRETP